MHYFTDRKQAGELLGKRIKRISVNYQKPTVIALNEGGAMIGVEISRKLRCGLFMLTTADVDIPGEGEAIGIASSEGNFTYNPAYSSGQLEEMNNDYRPIIDQERYHAFQKLNRIVGKEGYIKKSLLKKHEIILAADGLRDSMQLEVAVDYLKPIDARKIIVATPIAAVSVIDRLHLLADEIYCLGVVDNYFSTKHYYQNNQIPDHKTAVKMIKNSVFSW